MRSSSECITNQFSFKWETIAVYATWQKIKVLRAWSPRNKINLTFLRKPSTISIEWSLPVLILLIYLLSYFVNGDMLPYNLQKPRTEICVRAVPTRIKNQYDLFPVGGPPEKERISKTQSPRLAWSCTRNLTLRDCGTRLDLSVQIREKPLFHKFIIEK